MHKQETGTGFRPKLFENLRIETLNNFVEEPKLKKKHLLCCRGFFGTLRLYRLDQIESNRYFKYLL